jgi:hypothetical protein
MQESFLLYHRQRYLWASLALCAIAIVAYAWHQPDGPANGGTWLGYTLGGIAAALILWLTALGIRKRRYRSTLGRLQGWVSAHVYLGLSLLVIATLHCGFQFGWNIHTLAYALMCVVIASGIVGVVLYIRYPRQLSSIRSGLTREQLQQQLAELDAQSLRLAAALPAEFVDVMRSNRDRVRLGDGLWALLAGRDRSQALVPAGEASVLTVVPNPHQTAVMEFLSDRLSRSTRGDQTRAISELLALVTARGAVLDRLRRHAQMKAWLDIWLFFHVPATLALLAALIAHVFAVFVYW